MMAAAHRASAARIGILVTASSSSTPSTSSTASSASGTSSSSSSKSVVGSSTRSVPAILSRKRKLDQADMVRIMSNHYDVQMAMHLFSCPIRKAYFPNFPFINSRRHYELNFKTSPGSATACSLVRCLGLLLLFGSNAMQIQMRQPQCSKASNSRLQFQMQDLSQYFSATASSASSTSSLSAGILPMEENAAIVITTSSSSSSDE